MRTFKIVREAACKTRCAQKHVTRTAGAHIVREVQYEGTHVSGVLSSDEGTLRSVLRIARYDSTVSETYSKVVTCILNHTNTVMCPR
jgi:hypothetical protein